MGWLPQKDLFKLKTKWILLYPCFEERQHLPVGVMEEDLSNGKDAFPRRLPIQDLKWLFVSSCWPCLLSHLVALGISRTHLWLKQKKNGPEGRYPALASGTTLVGPTVRFMCVLVYGEHQLRWWFIDTISSRILFKCQLLQAGLMGTVSRLVHARKQTKTAVLASTSSFFLFLFFFFFSSYSM